MAVHAFSQVAPLAPMPMPVPFPSGSSVFQWDYQYIGAKACGFTGLGISRLSMKSVSIVLVNIKVGETQIPTYFFWGKLLDGNSVEGMIQDPYSFKTLLINMKLIAAGSPGL
jgi:hypothetical protein